MFFTNNYLQFFKKLSKNNNRDWFQANRETYESDVKLPFRSFVSHIITELSKEFPEICQDSSKCIFRINKDIRFSKDKSPYKTNMAAVFAPKGTKDVDYPGFYLHLGIDELLIGGGCYFASKEQIAKIRQEIYYNPKEFRKAIEKKSFVESFGELKGEKNKIIDKEYKEFSVKEPYILNKQWWFFRNLNPEDIVKSDFDRIVLKHFKNGNPVNQFLKEALKG